MSYTSSIINKYGFPERVPIDVTILNRIIDQQGIVLLLDVIAESIGQNANKFNFSEQERMRVRDSYLTDLREAINERI